MNKYPHLLRYYLDNECSIYNESILHDTPDDELLGEIENHFNEEEMLKDLPTGVIKDMFSYYIKHNK